jgi:hypothetical protein
MKKLNEIYKYSKELKFNFFIFLDSVDKKKILNNELFILNKFFKNYKSIEKIDIKTFKEETLNLIKISSNFFFINTYYLKFEKLYFESILLGILFKSEIKEII